uniref:AAA domain-containing protein n=1 Tax=Ganoderma boninense TaxID=34458 RepID=A0A5K1K3K0_9APHY|nr:AAA domain-containing protein [Ganoderma boninense]
MPIRGKDHSSSGSEDPPFFRSLADLDQWATSPAATLRTYEGVVPYTTRSSVQGLPNLSTRGKLLACTVWVFRSNPLGKGNTVLILPSHSFSHHRVTIPPPGWSTAAHRHGVKMLGVLIFEGAESQGECLQLLVGPLPRQTYGPAKPNSNQTLPVSAHYARLLAELAYQRGFDGYLLNFEAPLPGGVEQARALTLWISLLEQELKRKVGPHAEAMWYDSVVVTGQLRWQDRLNSINLPFFLPATSFFSNYTWPHPFPFMTAQYLLSLDQSIAPRPKLLADIYMGVDVWGRGSHGGGGFGCYKAISHIDPEFLGLSVALFGQGWTWESEQDKPGWSWAAWWAYERTLWLGPATPGEPVDVPPHEPKKGEPPCEHGAFQPLAQFFPRMPPPDPATRPFFTAFSPGVGWKWFVRGTRVFESETGWTDVDKAGSIGDLVFPRPTLAWEDEHGHREEAVPAATADISMDDAWLGGSSLAVSISALGSDSDDAFFRCLWLPIQSLAITPRKCYRLSIIYKISGPVDADIGASVKSLAPDLDARFDVTFVPAPSSSDAPLPAGWTELLVDFTLVAATDTAVLSAAGLVIGFTCEDPTQPVAFTLFVGALSVFANPPSPRHTLLDPKIIWAHFASASAPQAQTHALVDAAWVLDAHPMHAFAYFNVYVQAYPGSGAAYEPEAATFVGTTGLDGRANRFYVDPACLPPGLKDAGVSKARFYLQGVTDRGRVVDWEECAFVDVDV